MSLIQYWWVVPVVVGLALSAVVLYRHPVVEWVTDRFRAVISSSDPYAKRYWWAVPVTVFGAVFAYGFYLSLGLRLASLWVAFGSLITFVLGMGLFIGGPFLVSRKTNWKVRYPVFRFYNWLFRQAFGRGQMVKREHAGVELCASVFDPDRGSEHVKLDGEWRDFEDAADRMQYLRSGGAFGILLERSTLLVDPVDAAIGAARKEVIEAGEEVVDMGGAFGECVREHVVLPDTAPLVNLRDARHLLGGNAEPTDAEATEEFEKKAWFEHQSVPVVDAMVMAGLFAATLFVIWLLFSFKDGGGSSSGGNGIEIISSSLALLWGLRR